MNNIPNWLTLNRFLVLPIFILGAYVDNYVFRIFLLCVYIVSAFTDFLDGYIARHFNMYTNFGRIFDPISDKALVIIILLTIMLRSQYVAKFIFIPLTLIILREIIISGLREGLSSQKIEVHVTKLAKYKTATQMVAVSFLLAGSKILPFFHLEIVGIVLLWIATIITLVSGIDYLIKSKKYLNS